MMADKQVLCTGEPCPLCSGIFSSPASLQALASKEGYAYVNIAEARQSAARGCPICQMIANIYANHVPGDFDRFVLWASIDGKRCQTTIDDNSVSDAVRVSCPYVFDELTCWAHKDGVSLNWGTRFTLFAENGNDAAEWIPKRPVVTAVGSDFALDTARGWLDTCLQAHPLCRRRETPLLPTRAIDVGLGGADDDDRGVKLRISGPSDRYEYATLSYCWGGPQPVLLTATNMKDMVYGIPIGPLPQTIKDAIRVVRRLGVRFLWIDALCIIQEGDDDDKLREVGAMGKVYKNATITIAAASARGVSEGFLHTRAAPPSYPLPFYCGPDKMGTVQVLSPRHTSHDNMKPLNTRGWTLQEGMLTRRMLVYGEKEQVWRCQTEACKQFPASPLSTFEDRAVLPREAFDRVHTMQPAAAHTLWGGIVIAYTSRKLSFREDRVAAVTGIIAELKPLFDDECVFGIWRKSFLRQIAWARTSLLSGGKEDEDVLACAPAWSWASRSFAVHFMAFQPFDENCWKLRPDNSLVLTGLLRKGRDVPTTERFSWRFQWDIRSPELLEYQFVVEYSGNDVFYLLLGRESFREYRKFSMVLIPHERQGAYRRIGLVYNYLETTTFDYGERENILLA